MIYKTTYHNGAAYEFDQLSTNVTTLATITDADSLNLKFHDFLVNKVSIIAGTFVKGNAVLCGAHIEVNMKACMFSLIMELILQAETTTA